MSYKYALKYKVEMEDRPEGYSKEDAGEDGLTDAFLGISILMPEDGSYSQAIVIQDDAKNKRQLTQKDIFKVWLMLGISLHDQGKLEGWQKEYAEMHTNLIRNMFKHSHNCPTNEDK